MPAPRRILPLLVLAAGALALAGCAGGTTDSPAAGAEGSGAFPVTISHAFGETVIASEPSRVATVNWGNHDVPLALGVVPVGFQGGAWGDDDGDGILPWTYDALERLGATGDDLPALFDETDGIDYDAVDAVEPRRDPRRLLRRHGRGVQHPARHHAPTSSPTPSSRGAPTGATWP